LFEDFYVKLDLPEVIEDEEDTEDTKQQ